MDTLNGRLPTMVSGGNDRSSQCGTSSVGKSSATNIFCDISLPPRSDVISNHKMDTRAPLTGDIVVEDVSHVDLEGAPGCRLEEAQRRQKARVLLDDVHLLRPARQKGSGDPAGPGTHFNHDLRFGNELN